VTYLAVTLLRAVPARYRLPGRHRHPAGALPDGLQRAWFEVFLGGRWYTHRRADARIRAGGDQRATPGTFHHHGFGQNALQRLKFLVDAYSNHSPLLRRLTPGRLTGTRCKSADLQLRERGGNRVPRPRRCLSYSMLPTHRGWNWALRLAQIERH
jgi:hypothetical protein